MTRKILIASILMLTILMPTSAAIGGNSNNIKIKTAGMASLQADSINYYYGAVKYATPDGAPKGETVSLAKRTLSPGKGQIIEVVLQPSRTPGQPAGEFTTTMTRIGEMDEFSVEDTTGGFKGRLKFTGKAWSWQQWSYDIQLNSGDKITGEGLLTDAGLQTKKSLSRNGHTYLIISEDLKKITETEYQQRQKEMLGK